ncbi:MAG: hypothetical protein KDC08_08545 [Actinobacteria bacterium]|nr:hypothetical protein [Actinomycetota bacterium]
MAMHEGGGCRDGKPTSSPRVGGEVSSGALDEEFPLSLSQSRSGTQTDMNVNEVVANRCIQLAGRELGSKTPIPPNDAVNMSRSSNDTFPRVIQMVAHELIVDRTLPAVRARRDALDDKAGRTHQQDAMPMTVGQKWSGYVARSTTSSLNSNMLRRGCCPWRSGAPPRVRESTRQAATTAPQPSPTTP